MLLIDVLVVTTFKLNCQPPCELSTLLIINNPIVTLGFWLRDTMRLG